MTKHTKKNPSKYFPKFSTDWCHICGDRSNPHIEIWYPNNAEHERNNFENNQQGNRYLHYTNYTVQEHGQQRDDNNNYIRICKNCLKHSIDIIHTSDDGNRICNKTIK